MREQWDSGSAGSSSAISPHFSRSQFRRPPPRPCRDAGSLLRREDEQRRHDEREQRMASGTRRECRDSSGTVEQAAALQFASPSSGSGFGAGTEATRIRVRAARHRRPALFPRPPRPAAPHQSAPSRRTSAVVSPGPAVGRSCCRTPIRPTACRRNCLPRLSPSGSRPSVAPAAHLRYCCGLSDLVR